MFVVVMAVVVRGARGQIILGGGIQAQDQARINAPLFHREDRQFARGFSLDDRAGGGQPRLARQIGL